MSETMTRVGGGVLCVAAVVIGAVPVAFRAELAVIGGSFTIVGLVFAALVGICGLVAIAQPKHGLYAGIFGVVFSVLSLIGALGGLFLGMLLGIAGGIIAIVGGARSDGDATPD